MKKTILTLAAALGLFTGGVGTAQFFKSLDTSETRDATLAELPAQAEALIRRTQGLGNPSAAQISQVNAEVAVQLQYMQVRQNAEIIRLLTQIAAKK
ncbi:hypothetical protein Dcar01_03569 [Deinococcus carri]|uniref:DUF4168 domain-containing protein n=1 Tax=Deinococcus carri TaxID=1211323 RepID=A0ABP9WFE1_9DEIO